MRFKGLNANNVTVDASLSNGLIGKSIKNNRGLNSDTIEKILYAYEDLNPEWLITGFGQMLKKEDRSIVMEPNPEYGINKNETDLIQTQKKLIRNYEIRLSELEEKIKLLESQKKHTHNN